MCKHIKLYSIVCISSGILGIIVAFSIPKVYSSSVVLAPEMGNNNSIGGGLSSLANMAGIDLNKMGDVDGALYLQIYPSIISSTTFIKELEKIEVQPKDSQKAITFKDYLKTEKWLGGIIRLRFCQKCSKIRKKKSIKTALFLN